MKRSGCDNTLSALLRDFSICDDKSPACTPARAPASKWSVEENHEKVLSIFRNTLLSGPSGAYGIGLVSDYNKGKAALECLKNKDEKGAAFDLSEVHATRVTDYAINKCMGVYKPPSSSQFLIDKSKVEFKVEDMWSCMTKKISSVDEIVSLLPPSWVVIQITSKTSVSGRPSQRPDTMGLWITRMALNDPVVVAEVPEMPDLKMFTLLKETEQMWNKGGKYRPHTIQNLMKNLETWLGGWKCLVSSQTPALREKVRKYADISLTDADLTKLTCAVAAQKLISKEDLLSIYKLFLSKCDDGTLRNLEGVQSETCEESTYILILDKELWGFPWEGMSVFERKDVCRMPSLKILRGMLLHHPDRTVDTRSLYYVLNPGTDLAKSEDWFKNQLQANKNWKGLTGKAPTEDDIRKALTEYDIYLYIGHGSGTVYLPKTHVERLEGCAVGILMGCASASLRQESPFVEAYGTPTCYLLAGSRCLTGFLWPVSDRMANKITQKLLDTWLSENSTSNKSLSKAIAEIRSSPDIDYDVRVNLVVHGLPVFPKNYSNI